MAPLGHLHFHPKGDAYCDDFSAQHLGRQGFFLHEMTHVWQTQTRGRLFLIFRRMPWARYKYVIKPGLPLEKYGVEQQAEIIRHAFLSRNGVRVAGMAEKSVYDELVRFPGAAD